MDCQPLHEEAAGSADHPSLSFDTTSPSSAQPEEPSGNVANQPELDATSLSPLVELNMKGFTEEEARRTMSRIAELARQKDPAAVHWARMIDTFDELWNRSRPEGKELRLITELMCMHAQFLSRVESLCLEYGRQDIEEDMSNLLFNVNRAVSQLS
ncbi:hypothetical protein DFP72DRAFT_907527 [Ephemerocybe angulata]|uniref:Uncharacterized protein n=1 Tax=Ephemerocybe angulata TaxID=980116 RepID=A0A8H6HT65_9AGAR|nr:hypothetical protein DFP72DRAFT_907527 [Tulosesus angulatus]